MSDADPSPQNERLARIEVRFDNAELLIADMRRESAERRAEFERRRAEDERRSAERRAEVDRQIAEMRADTDRKIAGWRAEAAEERRANAEFRREIRAAADDVRKGNAATRLWCAGFAAAFLFGVGALLFGLFQISIREHDAAKAEIAAFHDRMNRMDARIDSIESMLRILLEDRGLHAHVRTSGPRRGLD